MNIYFKRIICIEVNGLICQRQSNPTNESNRWVIIKRRTDECFVAWVYRAHKRPIVCLMHFKSVFMPFLFNEKKIVLFAFILTFHDFCFVLFGLTLFVSSHTYTHSLSGDNLYSFHLNLNCDLSTFPLSFRSFYF